MHSPDCSIERAPRAQFVIVSANRFGRGDDVEFTESRAKANARSAALKRRGVTHRIMHEWRYPASHLFGDVWRPVLLPAGDRTLVLDYLHPKREDCVVRAIAIAAERPYQEVYDRLYALRILHSATKRDRVARSIRKKGNSPRNGNPRKVYEKLLEELGFRFVPTMGFGTGCKVHLRPEELPAGRIIVRVSKHLAAVVDGVLYDNHDCSRGGTRCVYGYYQKA